MNFWKNSTFYNQILSYDHLKDFQLQSPIFLYQTEFIPAYDLLKIKDFFKIFEQMNQILDFLES